MFPVAERLDVRGSSTSADQARLPDRSALALVEVGRRRWHIRPANASTASMRTIFVEAANQPVLRAEILRGREELASWMGPLLTEFGAADPAAAVEHLLALTEGLVGNQLATGGADFDAVSPIGALLRGLLVDP